MSEKVAYWASVILSAATLVLLIVNISIANVNHGKQMAVAERQAAINSGQTLGQLNQSLVQALAEAAVKNGDSQIRELLSSQGITMKGEAAKAAADKAPDAAASPAPATDKKDK